MALLKEMVLPDGSKCEYWKVMETNINWHDRHCHVVIGGFLNEEFRRQEEPKPQPRYTIAYDWSGDSFPLAMSRNVIKDVYLKLKVLCEEMERTKVIEVEEERQVPFEELEEDEVPGETFEVVTVEQVVRDPIQVYTQEQLFLVDAFDDL
jgi:hypothetical protein